VSSLQLSERNRKFMERINVVCERNRRDYETLARMTGKTIAEIEADTTAPDPGRGRPATPAPALGQERKSIRRMRCHIIITLLSARTAADSTNAGAT